MNTPQKIIGIIGAGTVAKAMTAVFPDAILYSPHTYAYNKEKIASCDIVFICPPTPFIEGKGCDLAAVENSFKLLKKPTIVIIRSTVTPGTTERLQHEHQEHTIFFNPEFLSEATAVADTISPFRQIIGFTKKSFPAAGEVRDLLPLAPYTKLMPSTEAEMVKYWSNTFYAMKVVFANQMYDLCQKLGLDYDTVKESTRADTRVGRWHLEIFSNLFTEANKGYRGYGGKCLPKDTKNLIHYADRAGINLKLLKKIEGINAQLREA